MSSRRPGGRNSAEKGGSRFGKRRRKSRSNRGFEAAKYKAKAATDSEISTPIRLALIGIFVRLILQLRFKSFSIMRFGGFCLVAASPDRPGHDEGALDRRGGDEASQEIADLRDGGDQGEHPRQAAIDWRGLVSFGLLQAARRRSAESPARKAKAAMHKVMWRVAQACERPRRSHRRSPRLVLAKHRGLLLFLESSA